MDSSAPKRRKTSPTGSIPVESTTPPDPPPQQQSQRRQPSRSPSAQPPSFASPTHSGLDSHNPDTLTRRRQNAPQRPDDLPASRPTSRDEDADLTAAALTAQLEHHSEGDGTTSPPAAGGSAAQSGTAAGARSTPLGDALRSPTRRAGGRTLGAQPPRRTPTRPQPRPLPPPPPEGEEDIVDPFLGRALRRSPNTGVLPAVVHEEPELPPTPEHPDPVVSTPPSGIHNTPSKRRRYPSEREAARQYGSPTKHPLSHALPLGKPPQKGSQQVRARRRASPAKAVVGEPSLSVQPEEETQDTPKSEFAPGTHPRRSVRLRGVDWEKKQERDALLREVAQLEADLELAKRENSNAASGLPLTAERDAVLDVLQRHLMRTERELKPEQSTQWLEAVMDPITMLGFNGSSTIDLPSVNPEEHESDGNESPPVSHQPIPTTASEELPYLQVFTPLAYTSTVATIPPSPEQPDQPTVQKHTITIRSATPPGIFTARLEMTVNTRALAVSALSVPRLDPAAAAELSPFIDRATSPQSQTPYHPGLTRNVSLVCWAMSEWYRVALKRAKLWHALDEQLSSKDGLVEIVLAMRARKKRKRRQKDVLGDGDSGVGDSFESAESLGGLDWMMLTKRELLPQMGRTSMDFEVPYLAEDVGEVSELRVNWAMEFDWAGEARSKLGVVVGLPAKWQATDERRSIVGIPKVFDKLIQGGEDPLAAVKTVVALLAGEPEA